MITYFKFLSSTSFTIKIGFKRGLMHYGLNNKDFSLFINGQELKSTESERRQRGDMIKIFHSIDNIEIDNNFSFLNNQMKGHCFKYLRKISRHTYRARFIFNR